MTRLALTFLVGVFLFVAGGTGDASQHRIEKINDSTLCHFATAQIKTESLRHKADLLKYVVEATRRGLSCVATLSQLDDEDVCQAAISPTNKYIKKYEKNETWTKDIALQNFVVEAKRRGLSCGVTLFHFDNEGICERAISYEKNGTWTKDIALQDFIFEAKRRNLS